MRIFAIGADYNTFQEDLWTELIAFLNLLGNFNGVAETNIDNCVFFWASPIFFKIEKLIILTFYYLNLSYFSIFP